MRLRFGLLLGGAIGYLLGTRAGRERYEQLRSAYENVRNNEKVSALADKAKAASETQVENLKEKAKAATAEGGSLANAVEGAKAKAEDVMETVKHKTSDAAETAKAKLPGSDDPHGREATAPVATPPRNTTTPPSGDPLKKK